MQKMSKNRFINEIDLPDMFKRLDIIIICGKQSQTRLRFKKLP